MLQAPPTTHLPGTSSRNSNAEQGRRGPSTGTGPGTRHDQGKAGREETGQARAPVEVLGLDGAVLAGASADEGDEGVVVGGQVQRRHEGGHAQRAGAAVGRQRARHAVQCRRLHCAVRPRQLLHQLQRLIHPARWHTRGGDHSGLWYYGWDLKITDGKSEWEALTRKGTDLPVSAQTLMRMLWHSSEGTIPLSQACLYS